MLVPLNREDLSMAEKDDIVHIIFSTGFVFPGSALSCSEVGCDLSKTPPCRPPPPLEETNSRSEPTFLPECELYSHSGFFDFFL